MSTNDWPTAFVIHATVDGVWTDYFVRDLSGCYTAIGGGMKAYRFGESRIENAVPISLIPTADLDALRDVTATEAVSAANVERIKDEPHIPDGKIRPRSLRFSDGSGINADGTEVPAHICHPGHVHHTKETTR